MFQTQWLVIGISGVTCSGKSTLATALYNYFINNKNRTVFNSNIVIDDAAIIHQDNYFLPEDDTRHQWIKKLNHNNWDIMSALDMEKMIDNIRNLLSDNFSLYNKNDEAMITATTFNTNTSQNNDHIGDNNDDVINGCTSTSTSLLFNNETRRVKILIIEGFLIFNHPQLLQLCQLKFYLHLPYEKCFERRNQRVYDPPDVIGYFEMCVWPMYEKHFKEFKDCDDIYMLNGETPKEKIFKYVLNCISNFL